jgi:DNA-binding NarL/FixJ family response regulator
VRASHPDGTRGDRAWCSKEADVIRVLLADDNAFVRGALAGLLASVGDFQVVAECADGDQVVSAAEQTRPDVVLLDLSMPRVGGLEAARRLFAVQPGARVVFLTANSSVSSLRHAHEMGAAGYLLKDIDPDELCHAVRTVAQGGTAWPESDLLTDRVLADTFGDDATRRRL